ncbi:hypothetical protein B0H19DRAFT_1101300 [Mycena capillaripes]|nr:hypothetical protein B0H19DRAFT_1101300 [Mycena capillaripes]
MDSENQPLLADVEAPADAGRSEPQAQHICSRCSSEMGIQRESGDFSITWRHILIFVAIMFSGIIFTLFVLQMKIHEPNVLTVLVTVWTGVTNTILVVLLYMGGRHKSKLGRTVTQIQALCALGFSWILLMLGMITQNGNPEICGWNFRACDLYTTAHVFSWFLIVILFGAAYATYRRAVKIHGSTPIPVPPVPAWRLSTVADGEGAIKI